MPEAIETEVTPAAGAEDIVTVELTEGANPMEIEADRELLRAAGLTDEEIEATIAESYGQGDPDDQGSDGQDGNEGDPNDQGAGETLRIGEREMAVTEIQEAVARLDELSAAVDPVLNELRAGGWEDASVADLVDGARTHMGYVAHWNSGPEQALEVVNDLVSNLVRDYGAKLPNETGEPIDLSLLDPTQLEGTSLWLYRSLQIEQRKTDMLQEKLSQVAKEGTDLVERVKTLETMPALAKHATAQTGVTVTGEELAQIIKQYGLPMTEKGAVDAVRLYSMDNPAKPDGKGGGKAGPTGKPETQVPKGAVVPTAQDTKVVDMTGLTVEQRTRMMHLGYTHKKGANKAAPAKQSA